MKNAKKRIDESVSRILAARSALRKVQGEARTLLLDLVTEMKEVVFRPSDIWKVAVESGQEHALANALDEEGVDVVSYVTEDMEPKTGKIHAVRLDESGAVIIEVQDVKSETLVQIREDATWDVDKVLEFVRVFGNAE